MIHPDTTLRFIDDEIGYGVIATKQIPAGTITWALDKFDIILPGDRKEVMEAIYNRIIEKYCYRNRKGDYVLCWDFGRYVNHSFDANCLSTGYEFEIAIRDIEAGEELTNDYGYLNLWAPFKAKGENTEREYVYPDDLLKFYKTWDEKVKQHFSSILSINQPLIPLLPHEVILEIKDTIAGKREMRSILHHYFEGTSVLS